MILGTVQTKNKNPTTIMVLKKHKIILNSSIKLNKSDLLMLPRKQKKMNRSRRSRKISKRMMKKKNYTRKMSQLPKRKQKKRKMIRKRRRKKSPKGVTNLTKNN